LIEQGLTSPPTQYRLYGRRGNSRRNVAKISWVFDVETDPREASEAGGQYLRKWTRGCSTDNWCDVPGFSGCGKIITCIADTVVRLWCWLNSLRAS